MYQGAGRPLNRRFPADIPSDIGDMFCRSTEEYTAFLGMFGNATWGVVMIVDQDTGEVNYTWGEG